MNEIKSTLLVLLVIALLLVGVAALSYPVRLYFTNQQTEIDRASNSYVTTKQNELNLLLTEYEGARDETQRLALKNQMRRIASTIKPEQIPSQVKGIIE